MAKKVEQLAVATEAVSVNEGDILAPLKKLQQQYTDKAATLRDKAYGDKKQGIDGAVRYYEAAARAVEVLIGLEG